MKPKICLSIPKVDEFSLEEYSDFEGYELQPGACGLKYNPRSIMKLKELFKGQDLSVHTELEYIFECNKKGMPEFSESEIDFFKAEIIHSKLIGATKIIFHLTSEPLNPKEKEILKEVLSFAKEKGVELIYESNTDTPAKIALDVLEEFPELNYCLDLGHINTCMYQNKLGMDLFEFLREIKPRLIHLHAHNNDGTGDDHWELNRGTFPWKESLDIVVDAPKLESIVLENKTLEDARKSKETLLEYLSNS